MQTMVDYINEDKDFINFIEYVEESMAETNLLIEKMDLITKKNNINLFFENYTKEEYLLFLEQEEESTLAKIGNSIKELIEKFINFVKKMIDKIKDVFTDVNKDKKIVEQMCRDNPSLGKEIVTGINNEWFTYGDVAKYNKDMMGLLDLLASGRYENEKFKEKMENIEYEYKRSENTFDASAATVMDIVGKIGTIVTVYNVAKGAANMIENAPSDWEAVKNSRTAAYLKEGVSRFTSKLSIILKNCSRGADAFKRILKSVISKGKNKTK